MIVKVSTNLTNFIQSKWSGDLKSYHSKSRNIWNPDFLKSDFKCSRFQMVGLQVFEWSKLDQSPNGLVFQYHLNTGLNLLWYLHLNTRLPFEYQTTEYRTRKFHYLADVSVIQLFPLFGCMLFRSSLYLKKLLISMCTKKHFVSITIRDCVLLRFYITDKFKYSVCLLLRHALCWVCEIIKYVKWGSEI